ncbi:unnamed protein product [Polarella glacialis]|uniref:Uncharacterized protein n=1 Tax=Polarella glacialis TaxID=89957 RepID=A0A813FTQ6_POLGL|nr:unnamed protein product [Polarella glacialis]
MPGPRRARQAAATSPTEDPLEDFFVPTVRSGAHASDPFAEKKEPEKEVFSDAGRTFAERELENEVVSGAGRTFAENEPEKEIFSGAGSTFAENEPATEVFSAALGRGSLPVAEQEQHQEQSSPPLVATPPPGPKPAAGLRSRRFGGAGSPEPGEEAAAEKASLDFLGRNANSHNNSHNNNSNSNNSSQQHALQLEGTGDDWKAQAPDPRQPQIEHVQSFHVEDSSSSEEGDVETFGSDKPQAVGSTAPQSAQQDARISSNNNDNNNSMSSEQQEVGGANQLAAADVPEQHEQKPQEDPLEDFFVPTVRSNNKTTTTGAHASDPFAEKKEPEKEIFSDAGRTFVEKELENEVFSGVGRTFAEKELEKQVFSVMAVSSGLEASEATPLAKELEPGRREELPTSASGQLVAPIRDEEDEQQQHQQQQQDEEDEQQQQQQQHHHQQQQQQHHQQQQQQDEEDEETQEFEEAMASDVEEVWLQIRFF